MFHRCMFVFLMGQGLVTGCGDDPADDVDRTAEFATMTTQQLRAVIEVTSGAGAASAYLAMIAGEFDASMSGNSCPVRAYAGSSMTLEATGCTTEDGTSYTGRVTATNAITLRDLVADDPMVDPSRAMSLVFEGFTIAAIDGSISVDGRIDQSSPTADRYRSRSTLTLTSADWTVTEDLSVECDGRGEDDYGCTIERAVFELDGLGRFTAGGSFGRLQGDPVGTLDMLGRQPLHVDLGAGPCHDFAIGDDGADNGTICWDEE